MRLVSAAVAAFLLAIAPLARADTITVFAASSLREVLESLAKDFQAATHHRIVLSFAASNALAKQVEAGAPADLFISADVEWADHVEARGLARPGLRRNVAGNELVLVAPAKSDTRITIAPGFTLGEALGTRRLSMANPDAVPAGKYAKAALVSLGAWDGVKDRIVPADSVRAALAFVAFGEAPLGIVYRSDAVAEHGVRVVAAFPPSTHPPIVYPLLALKRASAAGLNFAAYLLNAESRKTWRRFGFTDLT